MKLSNYIILVIAVLALNSCYPSEEIPVTDLDIVITYRNEDVTFSGYQTYAVADEVIWDEDYDDYNGEYDASLIAQIKANMNALGYVEVTDPETVMPDLVIHPEIIFTDNYLVGGGGCYYGCWGWGCPTCWWGGYPPYYPPSYVVSYSSGTILMHMVDPSQTGLVSGTALTVWNGGVNGLLRGSINETLLNGYVDQAFDQSAYYLRK
ncbi:MAG: DUF4136 domain-containing protein [Reichenbachiella sp.]|uniref:DUF4136 domain-containing protein n=1 Tax=Reichenbachiella sp. TaxID=2184521 RepID=UPI0032980600